MIDTSPPPKMLVVVLRFVSSSLEVHGLVGKDAMVLLHGDTGAAVSVPSNVVARVGANVLVLRVGGGRAGAFGTSKGLWGF